MYCKFCGKMTQNQTAICNACRAEFEATVTPAAPQSHDYMPQAPATPITPIYSNYTPTAPTVPTKPQGSRMTGFGLALTSVLLIIFGFPISIALTDAFAPFVFLMFGTIITSFIFGIVSIVIYRRCANEGKARPIATLVLGIHGLVISSIILLIFTTALFVRIMGELRLIL